MTLAIITTHPIQYYSPWYRYMAQQAGIPLRVFYLWDFGVTEKKDEGFGQAIRWDVPLLEGYDFEFVPNVSANPGTQHFGGIDNPSLKDRVLAANPSAVLMMAYNYKGLMKFIWQWPTRRAPLLIRGDSHRIIPQTGPKALLRRMAIRTIFSRFSAALSVGAANRDYFLHHGFAPNRVFFSPHTVDNDRFMAAQPQAEIDAKAWKASLGIPQDNAVLLFVGKLQEKKRPLDLLAAFQRAQLPNVSLLFVGSGELEQAVRERADGNPSVFFAPFQNQSQMPRTLAAGDLVALPSYGSGETWGLILNEAMCLSRAVLASTHVGCVRDLVRHGENGVVFEAGNVDSLTAALREAFADRERLRRWGLHGRQIVSRYSYQSATEGLLEALRALGVPPTAASPQDAAPSRTPARTG
ncbi:MAG TPA: glycosyltransferase family 4 protein [Salinarimonas sp.]|nr:glycosyltransferase family 4 protein [Salinarimonas sp.]